MIARKRETKTILDVLEEGKFLVRTNWEYDMLELFIRIVKAKTR